jgi:nucleotide-binding universal stress UspA family protein
MTAHVDWRTKTQQTINGEQERAVGTDSVNVSSVVIAGHPAQVRLEASVGAELLVFGDRGHGRFAEMVPGSVWEHVITHAMCSVLVMRHAFGVPTGSSE